MTERAGGEQAFRLGRFSSRSRQGDRLSNLTSHFGNYLHTSEKDFMTRLIATESDGQQSVHGSYRGSGFLGSEGQPHKVEDPVCDAGNYLTSHWSEL